MILITNQLNLKFFKKKVKIKIFKNLKNKEKLKFKNYTCKK